MYNPFKPHIIAIEKERALLQYAVRRFGFYGWEYFRMAFDMDGRYVQEWNDQDVSSNRTEHFAFAVDALKVAIYGYEDSISVVVTSRLFEKQNNG